MVKSDASQPGSSREMTLLWGSVRGFVLADRCTCTSSSLSQEGTVPSFVPRVIRRSNWEAS